MKDKLEKYIEISKKAQMDRVPYDKKELTELLQTSNSGATQSFYKRIFTFIGRNLIMTLTTLVALIVSGLLIFQNADETIERKNETAKANENSQTYTIDELDEELSNPDNLTETEEQKIEPVPENERTLPNKFKEIDPKSLTRKFDDEKEEIIRYDTLLTIDTLSIEDITFDQVYFDIESWNFSRAFTVENEYYIINGDTVNHSLTMSTGSISNEHLLKVLNQIEDTLQKLMDINRFKNLAFLNIEEFFEELAKINEENASFQTMEMINRYAIISRKFINDPSEEMKIKTKGIYLQKDILEKLGIEFGDNYIKTPFDLKFEKDHSLDKLMNTFNIVIPEKFNNLSTILNTNFVLEWEKGINKYDHKNNINWVNRTTFLIHRDEFDENDNNFSSISKKPIFRSQRYLEFGEFKLEGNYQHRFQPIFIDDIYNTIQLLIHPINFEDQEFNDLLKLKKNLNTMIKNNTYNVESNEMINIQQNIHDILEYAFIYSKLVPVDIHIPYYNLTEEELKNETPHYVTLWYYPTEEFLNVLPEEVRDKLILELELVDAVQKGEIQPEEACITVEEESLLGLCNLKEKNLSELNVYPNPAKNNINIKYKLEEDSFCKIFITNSNGNYLKDATEWVKQNKGTIEIQQDISDLNPGVYILHIVNENGDKLISKFVKE